MLEQVEPPSYGHLCEENDDQELDVRVQNMLFGETAPSGNVPCEHQQPTGPVDQLQQLCKCLFQVMFDPNSPHI